MHKLCNGIFLFLISHLAFANLPYYQLNFPRDEGAHSKNVPYSYKQLIEWWYLNGFLNTDDGKHFSYDIALFNPALSNGEITKPSLHIQMADLDNKKSLGTMTDFPYHAGKFSTEKLDIVVDNNYSLHKIILNGKEIYSLQAQGKNQNTTIKLDLLLMPTSPIFLINENGLMPMPHNTNSYYYSIPHFNTTGKIIINDSTYIISKKNGDSWMDHQWGDFNVSENGWEWFSIRLENGLIGNIFLNVEYKNKTVIGGLANIILPNGEKRFISYKDFTVSRDNYWYDSKLALNYPTTFSFKFPSINLELTNTAVFPEQEEHGYWEGACHVKAVYNKQEVNGVSYTEIVYDHPGK